MTLGKAFLDGTISPTLMKLWESRKWYGALRSDKWTRITSIGGFVLFLVISQYSPEGEPILIFMSCFSLLLFFLVTMTHPIRDFISDCKKLNTYIPGVAWEGEAELKARASERLIIAAEEVVVNERNGSSIDNGQARERFGTMFSLMNGFDLTEKSWDSYFETAERRVKVNNLNAV